MYEVNVIHESFQRAFLNATYKSWHIFKFGEKRIGYFHLWAGTHDCFKRALANAAVIAAQETDGFILDLRDGFGGASPEYLNPFFDHDQDGNSIHQIYSNPMVV